MAFLYATLGEQAFADCSSLVEVCRQCGISPRTMRFNLAALRDGFGVRFTGRHAADAAPLAADEIRDSADGEELTEYAA